MEKIYTKQSSAGTFPNPWSGSISDTVSLSDDPKTLVSVSEAVIILRFQFAGITPGTPINVGVPAIGFFSQVVSNVTYFTSTGAEVKNYSSQNGRGDAGYALQLIDYDSPSYLDNKIPMLLSPPNSITSNQWEVSIPFKFLFDWAREEDKYLPIKTLQVQYSWIGLLNAMQPALSSPSFNCLLQGIDYLYPVIRIADFSIIRNPDITVPPYQRVFVFEDGLPVGTTTYSKTIGCPGIAQKAYFWMLDKRPASADGTIAVTYNMNPNDASVISNIQITSGGKVFPTITAYNSINVLPTARTNLIRPYTEFQQISENWDNDCSSFIDFSTWLSTNRIYGVGFSGLTKESQLLSNIQFSTAITTGCFLVWMVIYT